MTYRSDCDSGENMMGKIRFFSGSILASFIIVLMSSLPAYAGPTDAMESLLMPGDVTRSHARYEKDCNNCHATFEKAAQDKLCKKCHKEIDDDIKKKSGYHGRINEIRNGRECKTCHTDHKGRDKDIAEFDKETFNHSATNFELKGWHLQIDCTGCHNPKAKFRDNRKACVQCHKKDDRHKTRFKEKCDTCHIEDTWKAARFNHDKTDFKLKDQHKDVTCSGCHPNERYENTPTKCFFCHELDGVHDGNHGKKCENCHQEKGWYNIKFDHNEDTEFELEYVHAKLQCSDCHTKNIYKKSLTPTCYSCHELADDHKTRYGKECEKCHITEDWKKAVFDHNEDTNFKLRGNHKEVICDDCHRGMMFEVEMNGTCFDCHQYDDVHNGQEGKFCQQCHDERGWDKKVVFDHDTTKFPLHGSHVISPCEECHLSATYKDAEIKCVSCHKFDDEERHQRRLGAACEVCHGPYNWLAWDFDHDKQTDFKLDGSHKDIDCHACHKVEVKDEFDISMSCHSCHRQDDDHDGNLGTKCDQCHVTSSFKKRKLN